MFNLINFIYKIYFNFLKIHANVQADFCCFLESVLFILIITISRVEDTTRIFNFQVPSFFNFFINDQKELILT